MKNNISNKTGRKLRKEKAEKFALRLGLDEQKILWIGKNLTKHPFKVISNRTS